MISDEVLGKSLGGPSVETQGLLQTRRQLFEIEELIDRGHKRQNYLHLERKKAKTLFLASLDTIVNDQEPK